MQSIDFYQSHLNKTSRSFAFCIEQLDGSFRQWISLSYLLCRILDTIEDSPWPEGTQERQYENFRQFLLSPSSEVDIANWIAKFPANELGIYAELVNDSGLLFADLHALHPRVRASIQKNILKMLSGMGVYSQRQKGGILRLVNLIDVNRYCYFVAGVVGDLITELYTSVRPELKWNRRLALNSNHFGLFLQKVNLLKDQFTDEKAGRFLVPDRPVLYASLERNARGALDYLLSLPTQDRGFRLFCAWSIFLGLASLESAQIPRQQTRELCARVAMIIDDNDRLRSAFKSNVRWADPASESLASEDPEPWLTQLVGDQLTESDLRDLGMC